MSAEYVSAIADSITALSAVAATGVAIFGLNTWRKEMVGRRRAELAEEVLADFYRAREVIARIRSVGSFIDEADGREPLPGEPENARGVIDAYYVPLVRLEKEEPFLSSLRAKKYRFQAVFGRSAGDQFEAIEQAQQNIALAARTLMIRTVSRFQGKTGKHLSEANIQSFEASIWSDLEGDDPIAREVNCAVEAIEAICAPCIAASAKL